MMYNDSSLRLNLMEHGRRCHSWALQLHGAGPAFTAVLTACVFAQVDFDQSYFFAPERDRARLKYEASPSTVAAA